MMQTAKHTTSFKALVVANRSAGRLSEPVAPEPAVKMLQAGMRLMPDEMARAREIAESEDRSAANFMRRMYLRGLESYLAAGGGAVEITAKQ